MEHNLQGENTCVWMYVCELHLAFLKGFATLIFSFYFIYLNLAA